ncbi:MAG: nucleoside deaminase [Clostridia bacterium]|nr:nucleoside deaminase [Clostridia bacterium]
MSDEEFMREALKEAFEAEKADEVPVGAIVVKDGIIVARGRNMRNTTPDSTAHAEVEALRAACRRLGRWNLSDCELFVTLEPCMMCSGAIVYSRIKRVVFGAYDKRFGCAGTVYNLVADEKFNHRAEIKGGVLEQECLEPIRNFFAAKRNASK